VSFYNYEHDDGMRPTTRRARIVKVDDKKSQQLVNISGLKNEKPEKIWRPQPFGFTSNPPKDSDGIMMQMGSRSDRTLYFEGGHEKHRPKRTPTGGVALFNHKGDIIRVFPDHTDITHQKKINFRIGKGYKNDDNGANNDSNDTSEDDKSSEDTKTISVVMDGDKIVISFQQAKITWDENKLVSEFGDSKVTLESGKATMEAQHVVVKSPHVDLGDEGGTAIGLCGGGCATKVFAV
jgi:phage gp45-like